MKLTTYNAIKCQSKGGVKKPTIYVHKSGLLSLSATLSKLIGLSPGTGLLIHQDADNPEDWYIEVSDTPAAFRLRASKTATCFSSVKLTEIFMKSLKITQDGITLPVSTEPLSESEKLYAIITSAVKRIEK